MRSRDIAGRREIERLRRRVTLLKSERDIPREAAAFFAKKLV